MATSMVTEDYVKVVYRATEFGGSTPSVSALAQRMGVAISTASENVKRLVEEGLLQHEPYGGIELTPRGRTLAVRMVRRHRLIETYLHERLGYGWDEVHVDAEILEHAASDKFIAAIDKDLGQPRFDPHGDPIPAADGSVSDPQLCPALQLKPGQSATVRRVSDADSQILRYLDSVKIGVGSIIRLIDVNEAAGVAVLALGDTVHSVGLPALQALWINRAEAAD